jgi:hypothetical protein
MGRDVEESISLIKFVKQGKGIKYYGKITIKMAEEYNLKKFRKLLVIIKQIRVN